MYIKIVKNIFFISLVIFFSPNNKYNAKIEIRNGVK